MLAALAKFAGKFSQDQIHVRGKPNKGTSIGYVYKDGSYNTLQYRIGVKSPISDEQVDDIIKKSGLYGLTVGDGYLEAYYVGDPKDEAGIREWQQGIRTVRERLNATDEGVQQRTSRLWVYGNGSTAIPYERIAGDVHTGEG